MNDISKKAIRRRVSMIAEDKGIIAAIESCGVSSHTLYSDNDKTITCTTLCKLCDGLGCTPNYLLGYGE